MDCKERFLANAGFVQVKERGSGNRTKPGRRTESAHWLWWKRSWRNKSQGTGEIVQWEKCLPCVKLPKLNLWH